MFSNKEVEGECLRERGHISDVFVEYCLVKGETILLRPVEWNIRSYSGWTQILFKWSTAVVTGTCRMRINVLTRAIELVKKNVDVNWHHDSHFNYREWEVSPIRSAVNFLKVYNYSNIMMGAMPSLITTLTIVYSTVYAVADQIKHQSSASLAFVRGIYRWPVNSRTKGQ